MYLKGAQQRHILQVLHQLFLNKCVQNAIKSTTVVNALDQRQYATGAALKETP